MTNPLPGREDLAANASALVAAVLFGGSVVAVRVAIRDIPPTTLAVFRFGLGALVLLGTIAVTRPALLRVKLRILRFVALLGVIFFSDVLHAALRPALIRRCNLKQHLDALGRVLMWVDRDAFDTKFKGGAIEYFYEPFLARFDENLRDQLGVWYTPREIADYQTARADHHLRNDFGIPAGITDDTVFILDPACGTGAYLAAVLRSIYDRHISNGEPPEVALSRTIDAATSRVIGFEILPAAFVIAHLHIGRLLNRLGASEISDRLRIYLTNSLTGWPPH